MDGFEEVEKNATPSSQAILYSPAPTVEERLGAGVAARKTCSHRLTRLLGAPLVQHSRD